MSKGRSKEIVWLTKYAQSSGVEKRWCEIDETSGTAWPIENGKVNIWRMASKEGRDWHRTRESAIARVEAMRVAKIASLEKQIGKLRKPIDVPE